MKIKRSNASEWLAREPFSVLAEDGITVDHVELAWTSDESAAFDFTARVPTAAHARDIAAQLADVGVDFPPGWSSLPEPAPRPAPTPQPTVRVEARVTPEGQSRRDAVSGLAAQASQHESDAAAVVALAEVATPEDVGAIVAEASAVEAAATATAETAATIGASDPEQTARRAAEKAREARAKAEATAQSAQEPAPEPA